MAAEWIKMRLDLYEDPAVIQMAEELGVREEVVVGYCHKFWCWVSRQCHDGSVTGVTIDALERVIALPEFLKLLVKVGWLEYHETGGKPCIQIPKFNRHLSQSAKDRALTAERKRHERVTKMSRSQRDKSVTREEKRRVYKKTKAKESHAAPSLDEVRAYFAARGTSVDPEEFFAHYQANGWVQGRGKPIKDWRACLTTWEKNLGKFSNGREPAYEEPQGFCVTNERILREREGRK